jgi:hypothetical protein
MSVGMRGVVWIRCSERVAESANGILRPGLSSGTAQHANGASRKAPDEKHSVPCPSVIAPYRADVEVTGAALLYRAASVWTAMLCHAICRWRFKQDVLDLVFFAALYRSCREVGY